MTNFQAVNASKPMNAIPATAGPLTANYRFWGELDINILAVSENGELLQALLTQPQSNAYFSNLGSTSLGGGLVGAIAAVQGGNDCYFFALTEEDILVAQKWDGNDWSGWWEIAAPPTKLGGLTTVFAAGNADNAPARLLAVTESARLALYDLSSSTWFDLGACITGGGLGSAIAVATQPNADMMVVCSTISGNLAFLRFSGGTWQNWFEIDLPSELETASVAATYVQTNLHIIVTDQNGMLWYATSADGYSFTTWQAINSQTEPMMPGLTLGSVANAEGYDHQLDLFSISAGDGELLWCWFTQASGWSAWTSLGVWPSGS